VGEECGLHDENAAGSTPSEGEQERKLDSEQNRNYDRFSRRNPRDRFQNQITPTKKGILLTHIKKKIAGGVGPKATKGEERISVGKQKLRFSSS